jgi:glycosyltransferase involved in cell wall biosynthesis
MNSRFETFSLICAEALRCGKPVVATRCGGPEEFIHDGNGLLVDTEDEPGLLTALKQMCSTYLNYDPEKLKREAQHRFGSDSAATGFDQWYRESIKWFR